VTPLRVLRHLVYASYARREGTKAHPPGDNTYGPGRETSERGRGKVDRKEGAGQEQSSTQAKRREDFSKGFVSNATGHG